MIIFNTNNSEVRFIKNILKNTFLPPFPAINKGDFLVADSIYIYKDTIIKCTKSGSFSPGSSYIKCDPILICGPDLYCGVGIRPAEYVVVSEFNHSVHSPGININFNSNSDNYDSDTHRQLGNYLRWYASFYSIDLMSLYNCFSNETISGVHLNTREIKNSNNDDYIVWKIPAQLNKEYSIFIDSNKPIHIGSSFVNNLGRIVDKGSSTKSYLDNRLYGNINLFTNSTFDIPIKFNRITNDPYLMSYSKNFYILLQVDKNHSGPIVVIENNVANHYQKIITNTEIFYGDDKSDINYDEINYNDFNPLVNPSLIDPFIKYSHPYADRLIEYLSEYTITPNEDIPYNIKRIKDKLNINSRYSGTADSWDDPLKNILYNKYHSFSNRKFFKKKNPTQEDINNNFINESKIVYAKDDNGQIIYPKQIVGLKNMKMRISGKHKYDILGFLDKDVENAIYKYKGD